VSASGLHGRVSYEAWHALHLLMYLGVALPFLHQLAGPDLAGHRLVQMGWALLYTQVFALLLQHRILTPLRQAARHRLQVAAVPVGTDSRSLRVTPAPRTRPRFLLVVGPRADTVRAVTVHGQESRKAEGRRQDMQMLSPPPDGSVIVRAGAMFLVFVGAWRGSRAGRLV